MSAIKLKMNLIGQKQFQYQNFIRNIHYQVLPSLMQANSFSSNEIVVANYRASSDSLIGQGVAKVYLGYNSLNKKEKVVIKETKRCSSALENMKHEQEVCVFLTHPNLVSQYYYEERKSAPQMIYQVIEYCSGGDLNDYIQYQEFFQVNQIEVIYFLKQFLNGYRHLYMSKVIHRDIKPHNLLISAEGLLKIADFGVSKINLTEEQKKEASKGARGQVLVRRHSLFSENQLQSQFFGTSGYIAPEVENKEEYSSKADVYSLGFTLYQMIYGQMPENLYIKSAKIYEYPQYPIVHPYLKDIMERMLQYNKDDRISWDEVFEHPVFTEVIIHPPGKYEFDYKIQEEQTVEDLLAKYKIMYPNQCEKEMKKQAQNKIAIWKHIRRMELPQELNKDFLVRSANFQEQQQIKATLAQLKSGNISNQNEFIHKKWLDHVRNFIKIKRQNTTRVGELRNHNQFIIFEKGVLSHNINVIMKIISIGCNELMKNDLWRVFQFAYLNVVQYRCLQFIDALKFERNVFKQKQLIQVKQNSNWMDQSSFFDQKVETKEVTIKDWDSFVRSEYFVTSRKIIFKKNAPEFQRILDKTQGLMNKGAEVLLQTNKDFNELRSEKDPIKMDQNLQKYFTEFATEFLNYLDKVYDDIQVMKEKQRDSSETEQDFADTLQAEQNFVKKAQFMFNAYQALYYSDAFPFDETLDMGTVISSKVQYILCVDDIDQLHELMHHVRRSIIEPIQLTACLDKPESNSLSKSETFGE